MSTNGFLIEVAALGQCSQFLMSRSPDNAQFVGYLSGRSRFTVSETFQNVFRSDLLSVLAVFGSVALLTVVHVLHFSLVRDNRSPIPSRYTGRVNTYSSEGTGREVVSLGM